jgi:hypothetical protein
MFLYEETSNFIQALIPQNGLKDNFTKKILYSSFKAFILPRE